MKAALDRSFAAPSRVARVVALVVVAAVCAAIVAIGVRFLVEPGAAASGFGLPVVPDDPFLAVKGVRDIGSGLIVVAVLAAARSRVVGVAVLAAATIPLGDMSVVLARGGPVATALGVHGATCLVMVAAAVTLLVAPEAVPRSSGADG